MVDGMDSQEYVLLVGGPEVPSALGPALEGALPVRICLGPGSIDCPAVRHEGCPLRAEAKATVVYLSGEHEFHSSGRWDCVTSANTPPVVAVIGGGSQPPHGSNGFAVVGEKSGPLGVLGALALLVDSPDRESSRTRETV